MNSAEVGARSEIGKVRSVNEDRYLVKANLFAVADGMGGHRAGEIASQLAMDELQSLNPSGPGIEQMLIETFQRANRVIYDQAELNQNWRGMGTTLTASVIWDGILYIAHVGDSRAYLVTGGEITLLTQDHSVVGELVRNLGLSEEEAMTHPHRNLLTRALGTAPNVEVDTFKTPVKSGDKLILCTDGLSSLVSSNELKHLVMEYDDPQEASDCMIGMAIERGGYDNASVITVYIVDPHAGAFGPLPYESAEMPVGELVNVSNDP